MSSLGKMMCFSKKANVRYLEETLTVVNIYIAPWNADVPTYAHPYAYMSDTTKPSISFSPPLSLTRCTHQQHIRITNCYMADSQGRPMVKRIILPSQMPLKISRSPKRSFPCIAMESMICCLVLMKAQLQDCSLRRKSASIALMDCLQDDIRIPPVMDFLHRIRK